MLRLLPFIQVRFFILLFLNIVSYSVFGQISPPPGNVTVHQDSNRRIIRTTFGSTKLNHDLRLKSLREVKGTEFYTLNSYDSTSTLRTLTATGSINVNVTTKGSTCGYYNGSILAVASGGTPPYTYDIGTGWTYKSGNFPQVQAGTYNLIVTDAVGQSTLVEVVVGNTYPKLSIKAVSYKQASGCATADANVVLEASGGTPPYEYSMDREHFQSSNTFTNFYAGLYDFFVRDANGCIASFNSFNLSSFISYSCNATGYTYSPTACTTDGFIEVQGMGPNKPYTYSIDGINYQSSGTFQNLTSGMYPVHFKDAVGSIQIVFVPIYQSCYIEINYISVDAACQQNDGTLTVTAKNGTEPYSYTLDGVNYQSSNVFTDLAPGNYNITVKDANGFTNSLGATVYDRCPIVSAITYNETCAKNDGAIRAIPSKGTSPYQYSIDGTTFQSSTDFTGLTVGSYTLTLRDANGFKSTTTAIVNNACIQVSAQTVNAKCSNSNGSITASATNGTAPYQYSIDGTNFQSSGSFTALAPGSYTVTAKDIAGKSGSIIVKVFDSPAPSISASTNPASCLDNDGSISIGGTGGVLQYSYSIDGSNFQAGSAFSGLKSGSYTAYIKDGNGCINSKAAIVDINCPMVSALITDETCGSKNGSVTVTGSKGSSPYQYSIDGITFTSSQSFSSLSSGNYTITIKDALGVTNATQVTIKNVCPIVAASVTDGKCTENGGVITAQGSNGYSPYEYSIDGVNYQQSNVFSNLSSGDYTVSIKDSYGLMNTTKVTVQNFPSPKLTVIATSATCLNNDGQISGSITGGTAPYSYSVNGINFQNSSVFTRLSAGAYTVTVKDANGCTDVQNSTIALIDNLSLSVNKEIKMCEGSSARLTVSSNATNYSWSPANDVDNINSKSPIVSPDASTNYVVTATLGACSKKDSILVKILPAPIAIAEKDTTICYGQSVSLFGSGGSSYNWSPATYLSGTSSATPVVKTPQTTTTYSLKVTDDNGCSSLNEASVTISVTPPAKLFAGNDTVIVMGDPFQLMASNVNNSGFVQYLWSPSEGLNNSIIQNPVITLNHDAVYQVVAKTSAGCEGSDEIAIKVYKGPDIFVPTAFTPNNDGLNDILKAIPVGIKQFKYIAVFNRYGQRVYYSSDYSKGWDGTFHSQLQSANIFVWMAEGIDAKGNVIKKKGTVLLMK